MENQLLKTKKSNVRRLSDLFLCCLFFISTTFNAQINSDTLKAKDLVSLAFEELMHVEIKVAGLTDLEKIKTPGSITTITKEDIEATPYRNLSDLLEVYVPGGTFVNHIRYVYQFWEEGNNRQYPRQVGFVNEPRTLGLKLELNL